MSAGRLSDRSRRVRRGDAELKRANRRPHIAVCCSRQAANGRQKCISQGENVKSEIDAQQMEMTSAERP